MSDQEQDNNIEEPPVPKSALCYLCDSAEVVGTCIHCNKKFCIKDVNKLDARYCAECMSDIVIEDTTFTKTSSTYDDITDTIHTESKTCRDIKFDGIDWMFACRRLSGMSDTEAKIEIEYHRAMVHFLESDLLQRSVVKYKLKVQSDIAVKDAKRAARIENQTTTRTRKVVKTAAPFNAEEFAKQLIAMGLGNIDLTVGKK